VNGPDTRYAETRTFAIFLAHIAPRQNGGRSEAEACAIGLASSSDCWMESGDLMNTYKYKQSHLHDYKGYFTESVKSESRLIYFAAL